MIRKMGKRRYGSSYNQKMANRERMFYFPLIVAALLFIGGCGSCGSSIFAGDAGEQLSDQPVSDLIITVPDGEEGETFVTWAKSYGGANIEKSFSIQQTNDGGYVVAGNTDSFGAGITDSLIIKLNSSGDILWQKTFGGNNYDEVYFISQDMDGGYILGGLTYFYSVGLWIFKLDASGNMVWQKTYEGEWVWYVAAVQQTLDGGYIAAGYTEYSSDEYKTDGWIVKLDGSGNIEWKNKYGGPDNEFISSIQQTSDGGYVAGGCISPSGGWEKNDGWVLRLDASGGILWQKKYGGTDGELLTSVYQTSDEGYIAVGFTTSFDSWIIKLDQSGRIEWQKAYSCYISDVARSIKQTPDGGYVVAGDSQPIGSTYPDVWVFKINASGEMQWQRLYGSPDSDEACSLWLTSDGGYAVAGWTGGFGAGGADYWILRLDETGLISDACPQGLVKDSWAVVTDTHAETTDTNLTPATSGMTVANSDYYLITSADSSVLVETQCAR